ncbi:MAG: acyltransferase [Verrucomicrobia bacterium]|nr:acyltransferase [Verrucomicrobiota bacterium]
MEILSPAKVSAKNTNLSGRLHFLDAIRGIAAFSVMLFHFYSELVSPLHKQLESSIPSWLGGCIDSLARGVDIFFVLSGFVIAASLHGKEMNPSHAGNFILRRALRLTPPYWVACSLMLAYFVFLWPTKWQDFYGCYGGVKGILSNFFYIQNLSLFYPANSILDVSWTLCLEVQFYATYVGILIAGFYAERVNVRKTGSVGSIVVGLGIAVLACVSFAYDCNTHLYNFVSRVWMFLLGICVYTGYRVGCVPHCGQHFSCGRNGRTAHAACMEASTFSG